MGGASGALKGLGTVGAGVADRSWGGEKRFEHVKKRREKRKYQAKEETKALSALPSGHLSRLLRREGVERLWCPLLCG